MTDDDIEALKQVAEYAQEMNKSYVAALEDYYLSAVKELNAAEDREFEIRQTIKRMYPWMFDQ